MEFFFETDLFLKILPPNFLTSGLNSAEFRYFRYIFLQDLKVYALKKLWILEENFTIRYSRVSQFLTFWCTSLYVRYSLGEINFTLFSIWTFSQCMSFSILRIELIITECKNNPVKMIIYFKDNIVEILSFRQDRIYRQNELSDSFRSLNRIN